MEPTSAETFYNVILAAQAIVFLVFCYLAFRTLYRLRQRAFEVRRPSTGIGKGVLEDQRATIVTFSEFFTSPDWRTDRDRLIFVLALLFGLMLLGVKTASVMHAPQEAPAPGAPQVPLP